MEKVTISSLSIPKNLSSKVEVIESSLHQTIYNFRDFVTEFEQMHMMTESVKNQLITQKEKCERKCCSGSEELKKVVESKENIIQHIAAALTKLNATKDFDILKEIFKILFGESSQNNEIKEEKKEDINSDININAMLLTSPKDELSENMSIDDQDVSQIDGTPTGRSSPIIQSKKLKSFTSNTTSRDKKNGPQSWTTPDKREMKVVLNYPTPTKSKGNGRLRQQRITLVRGKSSTLVDLTTTPQFPKGRNSQNKECLNIKQEVIENDDTIMPSPTSGPMFPPTFKSFSKESPQKFKKPLSLIRLKAERVTDCKENMPLPDDVTVTSKPENSLDFVIENHNSLVSSKRCESRHKSPVQAEDIVPLLEPLKDIDNKDVDLQCNCPSKSPLAENVNAVNIPFDGESSMSILRRDLKVVMDPSDDTTKRNKSLKEPLYKEPTVRKKAEKRALPGWSCEQCKNFYGELYKDDLEMQAKKMEDCSKHRGRNNPIRPTTPPGYWQPRWDVPDDTEEFNKRNNAV